MTEPRTYRLAVHDLEKNILGHVTLQFPKLDELLFLARDGDTDPRRLEVRQLVPTLAELPVIDKWGRDADKPVSFVHLQFLSRPIGWDKTRKAWKVQYLLIATDPLPASFWDMSGREQAVAVDG